MKEKPDIAIYSIILHFTHPSIDNTPGRISFGFPIWGYTLDLPAALASVKKLSMLPIEKLYCYHGGLVEDGIHEKFVRLLEKYGIR